MSRFPKAAARVLIVLAATLVVGLSLFAVMQLVVHPLMGPPRQRLEQGSRQPPQGEQEAPRAEDGEGARPVRRIRLRSLLGLAGRATIFGLATLVVILVQWFVFGKPPKFFVKR
jgi:hypothetical protein